MESHMLVIFSDLGWSLRQWNGTSFNGCHCHF